MLLGKIETPNKWSITSSIMNSPFIYINTPCCMNENSDSWGDVIMIPPNMRLFKVISQEGYKVTEYWCIQLDKLPQAMPSLNDNLVFPIAMKRFGYRNSEARFFVFQCSIFSLFQKLKEELVTFYPNTYSSVCSSFPNRVEIQKYSPAEYFCMALESFNPWEDYGRMFVNLINRGECNIFFPGGSSASIHDILSKCANVMNYSKSIIYQFDNCGTPHDIGINNESDILMFLMDYTPCDPGNKYIDVDYIGEKILTNNITCFDIKCIDALTIKTGDAINTLALLKDASKREELVNVENLSNQTLNDIFIKNGRRSDADSIQEYIDDIVTCLFRDEATTIVLDYNYRTNKLSEVERILGYGRASLETCRGSQLFNTSDQISFSLHYLSEILEASRIRIIKTYNEEMFMTVWYDSGKVESYYYNLIVHACVTGALFTL